MNYDYALSINSTGVNLLCSSLGWAGDPYAKPICRGMGSRLPQNHPSVLFPHTLSQSSCQFSIFLYGNLSLPVKKSKQNKTHSFRFPQNFSLITQTSEKLTWNFKSKWFGRSLLTVRVSPFLQIYIQKMFPFYQSGLKTSVRKCGN